MGSFPHRALTDGMLHRTKGRMLHLHGFVAFGCKGLGFFNQGKTQFINISLHKGGEGCFCFKAAGKLVSLCLGLPVLLPCYSSISSERLTSPLLPPAHFHGSRSRCGRPRPNSTAWMSRREGNGRVWEQGRAGARMEPVTRTGCT